VAAPRRIEFDQRVARAAMICARQRRAATCLIEIVGVKSTTLVPAGYSLARAIPKIHTAEAVAGASWAVTCCVVVDNLLPNAVVPEQAAEGLEHASSSIPPSA